MRPKNSKHYIKGWNELIKKTLSGRVISAVQMAERNAIKLQLLGKSRLSFQFRQSTFAEIPRNFKVMWAL